MGSIGLSSSFTSKIPKANVFKLSLKGNGWNCRLIVYLEDFKIKLSFKLFPLSILLFDTLESVLYISVFLSFILRLYKGGNSYS